MSNEKQLLGHVAALFAELVGTGSTPEKRAIIARHAAAHPEMLPVLRHTWDTTRPTGITAAGIERGRTRPCAPEAPREVVALFEALESRSLTGDLARSAVAECMRLNAPHGELVAKLFTRDTRTGVSAGIMRAALPTLFAVLHVALAETWNEAAHARELARAHGRAWISQKLDGVRLLAVVEAHGVGASVDTVSVSFMSRAGVAFTSLAALAPEIATVGAELVARDAMWRAGYVLDGEVVAQNAEGADDFALTVSAVRRRTAISVPYRYEVFDVLPLATVHEGSGGPTLSVRIAALAAVTPTAHCVVVPQRAWTAAAWDTMRERALTSRWEGLMVRYDAPWEGRRSRRLMKWKQMSDVELRVESVVIEPIGFKLPGGGERVERALSSVVVRYRDCAVNVGSGWTVPQRREYAAHPERIVGCLITVMYQEPIHDAEADTWSLRFPTLKAIHGTTRTD